mmetsp:Transcript_23279/g.42080  ORF Transcript_23279/g.42080 Transcript_23279/m.42080 type:complete len:267 (-) Transcript_23279:545-1345(-)
MLIARLAMLLKAISIPSSNWSAMSSTATSKHCSQVKAICKPKPFTTAVIDVSIAAEPGAQRAMAMEATTSTAPQKKLDATARIMSSTSVFFPETKFESTISHQPKNKRLHAMLMPQKTRLMAIIRLDSALFCPSARWIFTAMKVLQPKTTPLPNIAHVKDWGCSAIPSSPEHGSPVIAYIITITDRKLMARQPISFSASIMFSSYLSLPSSERRLLSFPRITAAAFIKTSVRIIETTTAMQERNTLSLSKPNCSDRKHSLKEKPHM